MKNIFSQGFARLKSKLRGNQEEIDFIATSLQSEVEPFEDDYLYRAPEEGNPILFTASVGFHHKVGAVVEETHPPLEQLADLPFIQSLSPSDSKKTLETLCSAITTYSLPDGVHLVEEDNQMFIIQNFNRPVFGVSCYRQVKTDSKTKDEANERACIQKSIVVLSSKPLFSLIHSKLFSAAAVYFDQESMMDKNVGK